MTQKVDWYYHRNGCVTCTRAATYLAKQNITPKETVPASRKLNKKDASTIAKAARRIIVAKGKKVQEFKFAADDADRSEVLPLMLGPTGNLRAPLMKLGNTVCVGFNDEVFKQLLG